MTDETKQPEAPPEEALPTAPPPAAAPPPVPPVPPAPPAWGAAPPAAPPPASSWAAAAPPPSVPPPSPPRRDRAALAVVLAVFGGLFLVFLAFLLLAYGAVKGESPHLSGGPRIGVLELKGEIGARGGVDADEQLKVIKRYLDDDDLKAVVVRIDSPGGAVAPSQEIYDELGKLAEKKTVVCSMGNMAASGGFYVAMACPTIYAEPGTLTGSIGVVSQFFNVKGLADRFDVKSETLKSGKLKDLGNPFREMTPEDRAYWQLLINQVYEQFVAAIVKSRGESVSEAEIRKIADGRVLTGQQAQELGLIDELGNFNDAVDAAAESAGLQGEPRLVYPPEERPRFFSQLMGEAVHGAADALRAEVHQEARAEGSPGLFFLSR